MEIDAAAACLVVHCLFVVNGYSCVKSYDSDLAQPVNECPHCAHDSHYDKCDYTRTCPCLIIE